jgi:hypothetical protein
VQYRRLVRRVSSGIPDRQRAQRLPSRTRVRLA